MPREIMNAKQTAAYLGVDTETIYRHANARKIPAFKVGSQWRFKRSLLDTWIEAQSCGKPHKK